MDATITQKVDQLELSDGSTTESDSEKKEVALENQGWPEDVMEHSRRLYHCLYPNIVQNDGGKNDREVTESVSERVRSRKDYCDEQRQSTGRSGIIQGHFRYTDRRMTFTVGKYAQDIPVLTCERRKELGYGKMTDTQPTAANSVLKQIWKMMAPEGEEIHLGGLEEIEEKRFTLPNHQLVITEDFAEILESSLPKVTRLCLKNVCIDNNAVSRMLRPDYTLRDRITTLCYHSCWYDEMAKCREFVSGFIPTNLETLCLSDCRKPVLDCFAEAISGRGQRLNYGFLALDQRNFPMESRASGMPKDKRKPHQPPRKTFRNFLNICDKVGVTIQCTYSDTHDGLLPKPGDLMLRALNDLTRFPQIVYLELFIESGSLQKTKYGQVLKKFQRLVNLETLRIYGYDWSEENVRHLAFSLKCLNKLKEFQLYNATWWISTETYDVLVSSLRNLQVLGLQGCWNLSNSQIRQVFDNSPALEKLHLGDCFRICSQVVQEALLKKCTNLTTIVVTGAVQMVDAIHTTIADPEKTPALMSVVIRDRFPMSEAARALLKRRYPIVESAPLDPRQDEVEYVHRMAREGREEKFEEWVQWGYCPQCREGVAHERHDQIRSPDFDSDEEEWC